MIAIEDMSGADSAVGAPTRTFLDGVAVVDLEMHDNKGRFRRSRAFLASLLPFSIAAKHIETTSPPGALC